MLNNRHLLLPRINSEATFLELCPPEMRAAKRRLCVVLLLERGDETSHSAHSLRAFVQRYLNTDRGDPSHTELYYTRSQRFQFAHLFMDLQPDFVNVLLNRDSPSSSSSSSSGAAAAPDLETRFRIVFVGRVDSEHVEYEWYAVRWNISSDVDAHSHSSWQWDEFRLALERHLDALLGPSPRPLALLSERAPSLVDELVKPLYVRIALRLVEYGERVYDWFAAVHPNTYINVLGVGSALFLLGFGMYWMNKQEVARIAAANGSANSSASSSASGSRPNGASAAGRANGNADTSSQSSSNKSKSGGTRPTIEATGGTRPGTNEPFIVELTTSNYESLVTRSPQGDLTVVLLVDAESKQRLLADFVRYTLYSILYSIKQYSIKQYICILINLIFRISYETVLEYRSIAKLWALRRMHFAFVPVDERLAWYRGLLLEALSPASPDADVDAGAEAGANPVRRFFGRSSHSSTAARARGSRAGGAAAAGEQEDAEARLAQLEEQLALVNPHNCVGTVLAINGARRYFCMYVLDLQY